MEVQELPEEALCRLCLAINKSSEMTEIFQGDKTQLSMRIMACTSLEVTPNDSMSSQLCFTCSDLLDIFYAFRKKCKSSDAKYRRFLRLRSAGKVASISDLSDDEDDEEYSVALAEFNERQKHSLDESLKQAKEELTAKYEAEKMNILQEEKLRIYREEKQKIQENAMRQIVSTLRQKEKDELKKAAKAKSFEKGKVFRILSKPTVAKETEKDDVEFEVIMHEEEKEDSRDADEDYTISLVSNEEYEAEEAFVQEKEDENEETEILYSDDIKSPEVEEVEEFEFLEEKDDDDNITLVEYLKKREPQETGQGSSSQSKDQDESQSLQTEEDEEKFFYLEVDEETEKTTKFYDAKGDLLIFRCSLCPKTFSRKKTLKKHELSHTQRKGFSCSFCEKWFPSNSSRMRHERIHTGDKKFARNTKKKVCFRPGSNRGPCACEAHVITTTLRKLEGEKPFVCGECGRKFVQKEILKRHVIVHSGEKPFKCNQCDKQFTQKEILRQHVNRKHTENPVVELHKCFLCPKSFCHASGLSRHLLVHAGRTFPCETCGKEFVDKSALKRHMNTIHK